jgi:hypothetical protein
LDAEQLTAAHPPPAYHWPKNVAPQQTDQNQRADQTLPGDPN